MYSHIFEVYTMLISDKILQNNTYLNRRTNQNTTDIDTFVGEGLSISLTFGLGAQVLPFSGFLASLVYRHIMNKTPAVKRTKVREREESFDSYRKELERTGNTEAIEVEETIRNSGTFERMAVLGNK